MSDLSTFESRSGKLTCTPSELFDFATDIRNFKQFVPGGASVNELHIDRESCSFYIPSMGNVNLNIWQKVPDNKVVYNGTVFQSNSFTLVMNIKEDLEGRAEVQLNLGAKLNPLLKMVAVKPIDSFLEKMIDEMEKFRGWHHEK
jgi:hypothetical protein